MTLVRDLEALYRERDDIDAQLAQRRAAYGRMRMDETIKPSPSLPLDLEHLLDERTRVQWQIEDAESILGAREAARDRRAAMGRFL